MPAERKPPVKRPTPRRQGAPSGLTAKLLDDLCGHLREGQPKRAAAGLIGVHRVTLSRWEERGKDARAKIQDGHKTTAEERLYAKLIDEVELALDFGEGYLMQQALKAARGEIKARATDFVMLLERTRPDQWRRRASSEYVDKAKPQTGRRLDVTKLDVEERAKLRELLSKAAADES